jgi:hypothetical protein
MFVDIDTKTQNVSRRNVKPLEPVSVSENVGIEFAGSNKPNPTDYEIEQEVNSIEKAGPGGPKWIDMFRTGDNKKGPVNRAAAHNWIKRQLVYFIKAGVPMDVRGKLISDIRDAKTVEALYRAEQKAVRITEEYNKKVLTRAIQETLSKVKAKKNESNILTSTVGGDAYNEIERIKHALSMSRVEANEIIALIDAREESGEISPEEAYEQREALRYAGMDEMSSTELLECLEDIKAIIKNGRTERRTKYLEHKEQLDAIKDDLSKRVIAGGNPIKPGVVKVKTGFKSFLDKMRLWQISLTDLMNTLSSLDKNSKPYQSGLNLFVDNNVLMAHNKNNDGVRDAVSEIRDNFYRITGVTRKKINDVLREWENNIIDLGTFKNTDGEDVNLKLTKSQMMDIYLLLKNDAVAKEIIRLNKFSADMIDAVNSNLDDKQKAWADWMMEFIDSRWASIDEVYESIYGLHLGRLPNYWPIIRDIESSDISEHILMRQDYERFASMTPSSIKARTKNNQPFKFTSATSKLINHVVQIEHFKAWAFTIRDLRSFFMDTRVRNAIIQYHGKEYLKVIEDYINDLARGGIESSKRIDILDKLRGNVAVAVLALSLNCVKTTIAILVLW